MVADEDNRSLATIILAGSILVEANPTVAAYLIGPGGYNLRAMESRCGKRLVIKGLASMRMDETVVRPAFDTENIEEQSVPVSIGQKLQVKIDEPHAGVGGDGIARVEGYVIDVEGGGALVGQKVWVEILRVHRTYAKAVLIQP